LSTKKKRLGLKLQMLRSVVSEGAMSRLQGEVEDIREWHVAVMTGGLYSLRDMTVHRYMNNVGILLRRIAVLEIELEEARKGDGS
jgi:hypothetical protein